MWKLKLLATWTQTAVICFLNLNIFLKFSQSKKRINKKPLHKSEGVRRRRRHTLPPMAVPSALLGLTSLFGMGRGEPQCNSHLIVVRNHGVCQDFESRGCHQGHRPCNTIILDNIKIAVVTTYKKETVTVGLWVISITRL